MRLNGTLHVIFSFSYGLVDLLNQKTRKLKLTLEIVISGTKNRSVFF